MPVNQAYNGFMPSFRVRESSGLPFGFVFSQSCLQAYADCPRSFQLRYLDRVIWPAAQAEPALSIERRQREGQRFHTLVHQHCLGLPLKFLSPLANTADVARWWKNYIAADLRLSDYTQNSEFSLSSPFGSYRLIAKYDLLALKDGSAVIYDWKTSTGRPSDQSLALRWQTLVYRALLVRAGAQLNGNQRILPQNISMVYWFADFPSQPATFGYDEAAFQRDWLALEGLVNTISSATEFPPPHDLGPCHYCSYASYCGLGEVPAVAAPQDAHYGDRFDTAD
jgi:hypothetical protein